MTEGALFSAIIARGPVASATSDEAWLAALLTAEEALARAQAETGLLPVATAEAIAAACDPARFDAAAIGRDAAGAGNPVVPLVAALRASLDRPAADAVHLGATSQDILDTAAMLVAAAALHAIRADLDAAADAAASLARRHRSTPMAGRTLMRQAAPTTFGAKAAGWVAALDAASDGLWRVRRERLAVQLGGAAGTLAGMGASGPEVVAAYARILGLAEPVAPWHADRSRVTDLAGALGTAAAVVAKPALDIVLLGQTEVGEVRDDRPELGGSSAMPHKQNPVAAIAVRACAVQAPGLVATLLAVAAAGEHERAAGAWHAEWQPFNTLLRSTGSAASWLRDALAHLEVDEDRMRANLALDGGGSQADRVATALTPALGRAAAMDEVRAAVLEAARDRRTLAETLADRPAVRGHLDRPAIADLLKRDADLGSAEAFVDRVLAVHDARATRDIPTTQEIHW